MQSGCACWFALLAVNQSDLPVMRDSAQDFFEPTCCYQQPSRLMVLDTEAKKTEQDAQFIVQQCCRDGTTSRSVVFMSDYRTWILQTSIDAGYHKFCTSESKFESEPLRSHCRDWIEKGRDRLCINLKLAFVTSDKLLRSP